MHGETLKFVNAQRYVLHWINAAVVFTLWEYNAEWRKKAAFQALWDSLLIDPRYGELQQELQTRFLTAVLITGNTSVHSKLYETFELKDQAKIQVDIDLSRRSPG